MIHFLDFLLFNKASRAPFQTAWVNYPGCRNFEMRTGQCASSLRFPVVTEMPDTCLRCAFGNSQPSRGHLVIDLRREHRCKRQIKQHKNRPKHGDVFNDFSKCPWTLLVGTIRQNEIHLAQTVIQTETWQPVSHNRPALQDIGVTDAPEPVKVTQ